MSNVSVIVIENYFRNIKIRIKPTALPGPQNITYITFISQPYGLRWFGHYKRTNGNRLQTEVMHWNVEGEMNRGIDKDN